MEPANVDRPTPMGQHSGSVEVEDARQGPGGTGSRSASISPSRSWSRSSRESDVDAPMGEEAATVELYRDIRGPWTKHKPRRHSLRIPKSKALVVRWEEDEDTRAWEMHSITIQSPYVRQILHKVFEDYPGVSTELDDLTFRRPFHEFFFRWTRLETLLQEESDPKVTEHCNILVDTLKEVLQPDLDKADDMRRHGSLTTFEHLWTLFEPGSEVYAQVDDLERLFVVNDAYVAKDMCGRPTFVVVCRFVDFDGTKLGFNSMEREIPFFKGVRPIAELPVFPSRMHSDIERLRGDLERRGRKCLEHCKVRYMQYSGFYIQYSEFCNPSKKHLGQGRIVVDAQGFAQENDRWSPRLDPLHQVVRTRSRSRSVDSFAYRSPPRRGRHSRRYSDAGRDHEQVEPAIELADELLVYCTPMVRGFILANKQWAALYIDAISEIQWSEHAFQKLLIPPQYKSMILAFVKSHLASLDQFDDVIQGKGQGFIMLLSGEPGVGKTLTAESVAEEMRRPLYAVSAGELGSTTDSVETTLQRVLNLCAKWHAVLLIDECDVFLQQRDVNDLERNRLVAVFLRLLEYYKGVMLLTTNRAEAVDVAFQSRIHLSIAYPHLDQASRREIWKTFTDIDGRQSMTDKQLADLSNLDFNGREIKNIARSARLLAAKDDTPLSMVHLNTVLDVKTATMSANIASKAGTTDEISWFKAVPRHLRLMY